ncbi:MAG TPA: Trm112 family protein [Polyangia bacterium]|nr:Trm112 family protein [Polyangia bacterium]
MALSPDLIEIVVCPKCKGPIDLRSDGSAFVCRACRLVYAVVDDIPNFLIEEAQPLEERGAGG